MSDVILSEAKDLLFRPAPRPVPEQMPEVRVYLTNASRLLRSPSTLPTGGRSAKSNRRAFAWPRARRPLSNPPRGNWLRQDDDDGQRHQAPWPANPRTL